MMKIRHGRQAKARVQQLPPWALQPLPREQQLPPRAQQLTPRAQQRPPPTQQLPSWAWRWSFVVAAVALIFPADPAAARCPQRPSCHGCGCAGGPGYRAPDGHCVGFRELTRVCGTPPTQNCTFENAPGTGANADCAMGSDRTPP
jgi:hypothetical protein